MHELALCEAMLELAVGEAEKAGAKRILTIDLRLGVLSGVIPGCVEYYFRQLSPGTLAENAQIRMESLPLRLLCRTCHRESQSERPLFACPHCGSEDFRILSGQEYFIESLEVE